MRVQGSILPLVLVVLALLVVAGPLALMGQEQLGALRAAVAVRQAHDLIDYALATAPPQAGAVRLRCPAPGSAQWSFNDVRVNGELLGAYARLPLRARRGRTAWCVAARTAGGGLNQGERVEVYLRVVLDAQGNEISREALP